MSIQESGEHGRGSKMRIKPECVVYNIMGRSRIIYKIIKIIQYIVIIILLFYVIMYGNSVTNFQYRLLDGTHDLPCSIYKVSYHHVSIPCDMWYGKITLHMAP